MVVRDILEPYLPTPVVKKTGVHQYTLDYDRPKSIGKVRSFYGNFGVLVRAYAYIRALGADGLREVSDAAVLNATYVMAGIRDLFDVPYDRPVMHEFVVSAEPLREHGVRALDVAKRNALKHRLNSVSFVHSSWFDDLDPSFRGHVDLIVANPPYVGVDEFDDLDPVLRYEPRGALIADDSSDGVGLADLEVIISGAPQWLSNAGTLICEHGDRQRTAVLERARRAGFRDVRDLDDLAGSPRVLVARR